MNRPDYSKTDATIEELKKQFESRERRRRKAQLEFAFGAAAISIAGLFLAVTQLTGFLKTTSIHIPASNPGFDAATFQAKFDGVQHQYDALSKAIYTNAPQANASEEQKRLSATMAALSDRMAKIEDAISATPDKALAVPLIRRDVDALSKQVTDYRSADRIEIDRLYDQLKWIVGGIGTVLLTILGAAGTFIFKVLTAPSNGTTDRQSA